MQPVDIGWIIGGIITAIGGAAILIAITTDNVDRKMTGSIIGFFCFISLAFGTALVGYEQGEVDFKGLPVSSLEIGKEYDVLAMNITNENVYLILRGVIDGKIFLYERPLEQGIPETLSPGDRMHLIEKNQMIITIDV